MILFFLFFHVSGCSGMFRNVPCSGFYRRPVLATVFNWFSSNLLTLNISKCNFVIFGNSRKLKLVNDVSLKVNSSAFERSDSFKYFGIVLNQTMS